MPATTPFELDRYLVPVDPRHVPQYRFDVVILGGGGAGGLAALAAADAGAHVAVVAKGELHQSNTRWAKGGMAAVQGGDDTFESHVEDTLRVGCGLSERAIAERVVRGGPDALRHLLALGAQFDRLPSGELALSKEGGHSHARIVHAQGDATGVEIQGTLTRALAAHPRVSTFAGHFAIDLLSEVSGRVLGVLCRTERGERVAFGAGHVVLATGGAGQVYRETTNPDIATADGVAMGLRAGATLRDMEFMQFHPTCLYIAGAARVLISEIVRGAGGILRDRHGERFMTLHHEAAELAPRDVVSRAVFERMVSTNDTSVYLDLSHFESDPHVAFPAVSRICRFFGIDIARDPIPVRPGAHYQIGGLRVDESGRTSVPGLWAVGECASTGLHGANRMGSNSLLEALVLGAVTGRAAAAEVASEAATPGVERVLASRRETPPADVPVNIGDITYSLKSMMWRQMGVKRDEEGLSDALSKLAFWTRAVGALPLETVGAWELCNMLSVARLMTHAALAREESRGVHFRTDHPDAVEPAEHLELRPEVDARGVRSIELVHVPVGEAALHR